MKSYLSALILLISLYGPSRAFSQDLIAAGASSCDIQPIYFLSTYEASRMWKVGGGEKRLIANEEGSLSPMMAAELFGPGTCIPIMIREIRDIYEDGKVDSVEMRVLIGIGDFFSQLFQTDQVKVLSSQTEEETCAAVNLMIEAYHSLSVSNQDFGQMIMTADDGPFFGTDSDTLLPAQDSLLLEALDSWLIIRGENRGLHTLELQNRAGEVSWRKLMGRPEGEGGPFSDLHFAQSPIKVVDDLGYKIGLFAEGEFIQLYLLPKGGFRLYFHSW